MNYVTVWSLKRGIIDPPEPVSKECLYQLAKEAIEASLERDNPLTQDEWWHEEAGYRSLYARKRSRSRRCA